MEWMRVRVLLIASLPAAVVFPAERAAAQAQQAEVHELPPVDVSAPTTSAKRGHSHSATAVHAARPRQRVYIATTPVPGPKVDADKVAAATSVVDSHQIERSGSLNVGDALQ